MNQYAVLTFEYNNKRYLSVWYLIDNEGKRWLEKDKVRAAEAVDGLMVEVREYDNYDAAHNGIFEDYNYLLPESTNK